jgi:hypothetical protein
MVGVNKPESISKFLSRSFIFRGLSMTVRLFAVAKTFMSYLIASMSSEFVSSSYTVLSPIPFAAAKDFTLSGLTTTNAIG